jgi:hypothetical protein
MKSWTFDIGNSTDGEIGAVMRVQGENMEEATARANAALVTLSNNGIEIGKGLSGVEYCTVYFNPDKTFTVADALDEDGDGDKTWTNHFYHHGIKWDDVWSCQCNDECAACSREIEPYASTDNETGEVQIHNRHVFDMAERGDPCCTVCGNAECDEHKTV